jgi:hypothetical protein
MTKEKILGTAAGSGLRALVKKTGLGYVPESGEKGRWECRKSR